MTWLEWADLIGNREILDNRGTNVHLVFMREETSIWRRNGPFVPSLKVLICKRLGTILGYRIFSDYNKDKQIKKKKPL